MLLFDLHSNVIQYLPHKMPTKLHLIGSSVYSMGVVSCFIIPWPRHNSCRRGVCGNAQFPQTVLMFLTGHGIEARNSYPCRNHTFPNSVYHQNLESTQPAAPCFPGPDDAPCWEMCDFRTCMVSCFILSASESFGNKYVMNNLGDLNFYNFLICFFAILMTIHGIFLRSVFIFRKITFISVVKDYSISGFVASQDVDNGKFCMMVKLRIYHQSTAIRSFCLATIWITIHTNLGFLWLTLLQGSMVAA